MMRGFRRSAFFALGQLLILWATCVHCILDTYVDDDRGILWAISKYTGESHVSTCERFETQPISTLSDSLGVWNSSVFEKVTAGLGCLNADESKVRGCCVPGLWYDEASDSCFTQSFGKHVINYGWFSSSMIPIYACKLPSANYSYTSNLIELEHMMYSDGTVTLHGKHFGRDDGLAEVNVGSQRCGDLELCTGICESCQHNPCPTDSVCLNAGNRPSCFMYCSGKADKTCPCNTFCDGVTVFAESTKRLVTINLCTPFSFSSFDHTMCDQYDHSDRMVCHAASVMPIENHTAPDGHVNLEAAVTIGNRAGSMIESVSVESVTWCKKDMDCFDGNLCTEDLCESHSVGTHNVSQCVNRPIGDCDTSLPAVQARNRPFTYHTYIQKNTGPSQLQFEKKVLELGTRSFVSQKDDYPLETIVMPFDFQYFGNLIRYLNLSPNGVLMLDPLKYCSSVINSVQCITFATDTNVVSLWGADWDPSISSGTDSGIHYLGLHVEVEDESLATGLRDEVRINPGRDAQKVENTTESDKQKFKALKDSIAERFGVPNSSKSKKSSASGISSVLSTGTTLTGIMNLMTEYMGTSSWSIRSLRQAFETVFQDTKFRKIAPREDTLENQIVSNVIHILYKDIRRYREHMGHQATEEKDESEFSKVKKRTSHLSHLSLFTPFTAVEDIKSSDEPVELERLGSKPFGSSAFQGSTLDETELSAEVLDTSGNQASNTFSTSLYDDGSIRLRYHKLESTPHYGDSFGLWGSHVSQIDARGAHYHMENISYDDLANETDIVYCPLSALACVVESCVYPGSQVSLQWNMSTCTALETGIQAVCVFGSGLGETPISTTDEDGVVSCEVPTNSDVPDGSIITLDIEYRLIVGKADISEYTLKPTVLGSHSVYGKTVGVGGEHANHQLMLRYHSSDTEARASCGCSPVARLSSKTCDSASVCGGINSTRDCFGTPFGTAYIDSCGTCAGGLTRVSPSSYCGLNIIDLAQISAVKFLTETILLITLVCCMSFLLSTMSYIVRAALARRGILRDHMDFNAADYIPNNMNVLPRRVARTGLSRQEREALEEFTYSDLEWRTRQRSSHDAEEELVDSTVIVSGVTGVGVSRSRSGSTISNEDLNAIDSLESTPPPECSICLMEFAEGDTCRILPHPCNHIFHSGCIDEWLKQALCCPMCKRNIREMIHGGNENVRTSNWHGREGPDRNDRGGRDVLAGYARQMSNSDISDDEWNVPQTAGPTPTNAQRPPVDRRADSTIRLFSNFFLRISWLDGESLRQRYAHLEMGSAHNPVHDPTNEVDLPANTESRDDTEGRSRDANLRDIPEDLPNSPLETINPGENEIPEMRSNNSSLLSTARSTSSIGSEAEGEADIEMQSLIRSPRRI